jgi:hypothetical protein
MTRKILRLICIIIALAVMMVESSCALSARIEYISQSIFWSRLSVALLGWLIGVILSLSLLFFTFSGRKPEHITWEFHLEDWIPSIILFLAALRQYQDVTILKGEVFIFGNWGNALNIFLALIYIAFVFLGRIFGKKAPTTMLTGSHLRQTKVPSVGFFHVPPKFRSDWDRLWIMTILPTLLFLHIFLIGESSPLDGGLGKVPFALFIFSGGGTWAVVTSIGAKVSQTDKKQVQRIVIKAFIYSFASFAAVSIVSWLLYSSFGLLSEELGILGNHFIGFCVSLIPPLFFFQHRTKNFQENRSLLAVIILVVIGIIGITAAAIEQSGLSQSTTESVVGLLYAFTIFVLIGVIDQHYPIAGFQSGILIRVQPGQEREVINRLGTIKGVYEARLVFGPYDIVVNVSAIDEEAANDIFFKIRDLQGVLGTTTLINLEL